ncbi:NAD(P)H-binding protein [Halorubrum sp. CBA1125]|uniref:NAD(P)H-binding protein n=1 Tax=Halorubrum sp. CBA1125 TaxID=2668072 RepID=UPI0012E6F832|nr:NAD(P)H-binding protein [Halorubrum sp. CBA1125]MUW13423.1 NAD(P)H-binding protein [Halorubrum sp. CBA1125]
MRILITGATGYIGLSIIRRISDTHEPVAMVRESSRTELLPPNIETVEGDITDIESLRGAFEGVDAVAHLAGVNPGSKNSTQVVSEVDEDTFTAVNVEGTRNIVNAATEANVSSLVYTSTTNAHPDVPYDYESMYVDTKRRGGEIVSESSLDYTIVHPTYVMGPYDYRLKRYNEFRLAAANAILIPPLYTPGRINIVHVDTLADSIIHYLEEPTRNRHLVSGRNIDRRTYTRQLASLSDRHSFVFPLPFHKILLPFIVRLVDAIGLANVSVESLALEEHTATVPEIHEERAPVKRKSWKQAVTDTYRWYQDVRLL